MKPWALSRHSKSVDFVEFPVWNIQRVLSAQMYVQKISPNVWIFVLPATCTHCILYILNWLHWDAKELWSDMRCMCNCICDRIQSAVQILTFHFSYQWFVYSAAGCSPTLERLTIMLNNIWQYLTIVIMKHRSGIFLEVLFICTVNCRRTMKFQILTHWYLHSSCLTANKALK